MLALKKSLRSTLVVLREMVDLKARNTPAYIVTSLLVVLLLVFRV